MTIQDFMDKQEYSMIRFSFLLIKQVQHKINEKTLFYVDQVWRFIELEINTYLNQLRLNKVMFKLYKQQMFSLIKPRVTSIIHKHKLFYCIG